MWITLCVFSPSYVVLHQNYWLNSIVPRNINEHEHPRCNDGWCNACHREGYHILQCTSTTVAGVICQEGIIYMNDAIPQIPKWYNAFSMSVLWIRLQADSLDLTCGARWDQCWIRWISPSRSTLYPHNTYRLMRVWWGWRIELPTFNTCPINDIHDSG